MNESVKDCLLLIEKLVVVYYKSRKRELEKLVVVYYKSRKRELKAKLMNESVR
jgi:hypothetical protein